MGGRGSLRKEGSQDIVKTLMSRSREFSLLREGTPTCSGFKSVISVPAWKTHEIVFLILSEIQEQSLTTIRPFK